MLRRTRDRTPEAEPVAEPTESAPRGKGRATPTRKEQEAARKRPLVPNDRKEAQKASKRKVAEERERARVGIAAGDDRYLTRRDKGPQRRYVRDYVDARFNVGEFLMPLLVIIIIMTFVQIPVVQFAGTIALWVFFLLAVADSLLLGHLVTRRLREKFGENKVEKGLRWYAAMRAIQFRRIRLPKPQVKRRQYPH